MCPELRRLSRDVPKHRGRGNALSVVFPCVPFSFPDGEALVRLAVCAARRLQISRGAAVPKLVEKNEPMNKRDGQRILSERASD